MAMAEKMLTPQRSEIPFFFFLKVIFQTSKIYTSKIISIKITPNAKVLVLPFFSTGALTVYIKVAKENKGRFFITKAMKNCLQFTHFNEDHHCASLWLLSSKMRHVQ